MDISHRRHQSISKLNMSTTILLLIIYTPMFYGASNTHLIGEMECTCSDTSAICSGISEEPEEIEDAMSYLFQNCSSTNDLLDLTLSITSNAGQWPKISFNHFKLQNLTLGYGLEMLNDESFYGLNSSLSSLNLAHNDIEFTIIQHSPFSILDNLKILNLDFNNLEKFDDRLFENLNKLEVLSLSGNTFTGLHANLLENLTAIETLILNHNKNVFSLSNLNIISPTLTNLFAKNCSFNESLESNSLSGISNLKYADFSSNQLIRVNAFALNTLHNLQTLDLSSNRIETLKNYSFSSLHSLEVLDLQNNEISVIEEFSFDNLTQLKILNLAGNKLYGFSKQYASDLYSLEKINLENNDIHYIEAGSFTTCIQLKELLLKGNAFGCWHCETMYVAGLLTNDTLFKREDADAIVCAEPVEMKDMPVAEVTPEKLEDYCDPLDSTSETPSTIFSTTEEITTDITPTLTTLPDTTTSILHSSTLITSVVIPVSTDATSTEETTIITESTTGAKDVIPSSSSTEIVATTESSSVSLPGSEVTETPETNTPPGVTTLFTTEITTHSTVGSIDFTSENETTKKVESTTIEVITSPVFEHTTTENSRTSESTTLPNTEKITSTSLPHINTTIFSTVTENVTTELPAVSLSKTETSQINTVMSTETDTLGYSKLTTTAFPTKKKPDMIRIINYSVTNDTICITWDMKWETLSKQWITNKLKCGVEIQHSTGKELVYFKNCPTNDREILACTTIENKYLDKMYKFCLNLYVSLTKYRSCSKYKNLPSTEKTFKPLSTTEPPTSKYVPPTQFPFVPFKVLKFGAIFNYEKSFVDVVWLVNRNERNSVCTLNLILMSHNFNFTEGVFSCKNNSYKIQNIKHESFQVCLRTFNQGHYAPLMCESSVPLPYKFSASSMKDDGYKNSVFIALVCLLILVVLIIIVMLLKKMLKKRSESDLYNVSAQEKNMLRRQASTSVRQDPCVRYSYTVKEQFEI